jgi:decaprenyl-phosphate phosphoribosyltransferase
MISHAIGSHVEALRLKQWIKSVFVFAPLIFSNNFRSAQGIAAASIVAVSFCMSASAVYLFNDVCDLEYDQRHPTKRNRPVARGAVRCPEAILMAAVLLVPGIGAPALLSPRISVLMAGYVIMNVVYSRVLKDEAFVDVMVIAAGFILRVVAGAWAIDVPVSRWMILTTFFLALFLGFGKRREEMVAMGGAHAQRAVLRHYSLELLNGLIIVTAALTITTYSLYAITSRMVVTLGLEGFVWTVPLVVFGVFRYLGILMNDNNGGDPAEILLRDRLLIADVALWIGLVISLLLRATIGSVT